MASTRLTASIRFALSRKAERSGVRVSRRQSFPSLYPSPRRAKSLWRSPGSGIVHASRAVFVAGLAVGFCACSEKSSTTPTPAIQTISDFVLSETERTVVQWKLRAEEAVLHDEGNAELANPHVQIFQDGKLSTEFHSKAQR